MSKHKIPKSKTKNSKTSEQKESTGEHKAQETQDWQQNKNNWQEVESKQQNCGLQMHTVPTWYPGRSYRLYLFPLSCWYMDKVVGYEK